MGDQRVDGVTRPNAAALGLVQNLHETRIAPGTNGGRYVGSIGAWLMQLLLQIIQSKVDLGQKSGEVGQQLANSLVDTVSILAKHTKAAGQAQADELKAQYWGAMITAGVTTAFTLPGIHGGIKNRHGGKLAQSMADTKTQLTGVKTGGTTLSKAAGRDKVVDAEAALQKIADEKSFTQEFRSDGHQYGFWDKQWHGKHHKLDRVDTATFEVKTQGGATQRATINDLLSMVPANSPARKAFLKAWDKQETRAFDEHKVAQGKQNENLQMASMGSQITQSTVQGHFANVQSGYKTTGAGESADQGVAQATNEQLRENARQETSSRESRFQSQDQEMARLRQVLDTADRSQG